MTVQVAPGVPYKEEKTMEAKKRGYYFSPAGFVSLLQQRQAAGLSPVTIAFSSSPERGAWEYGRALKQAFPILPQDPQECLRLIRQMSEERLIEVAVSGDREHCPQILEARISLASTTPRIASCR